MRREGARGRTPSCQRGRPARRGRPLPNSQASPWGAAHRKRRNAQGSLLSAVSGDRVPRGEGGPPALCKTGQSSSRARVQRQKGTSAPRPDCHGPVTARHRPGEAACPGGRRAGAGPGQQSQWRRKRDSSQFSSLFQVHRGFRCFI